MNVEQTVKQAILREPSTLAAPVNHSTARKVSLLVFNRFAIDCSIHTFDCERDEWMVAIKDGQKIKKQTLNEVRFYVSGILDTLRSL